MSDKSAIEWTDATWNPIRARNLKTGKVGWHCEHATTGCEFCYAESFNKRLGTGLDFKPGHRRDIEIFLDEEMLTQPLRWKKPRMIFVCSMTDLFAEFVTDEQLDKIFAVMALSPQHTFQVLTKRAERMRDYMATPERKRLIAAQSMPISCLLAADGGHEARIKLDHFSACFAGAGPFPNIWLGVSTERQQEADERIPLLLQTPAAVRFISAEPLLGPIDLEPWLSWPDNAPDVDDKSWGCQECDGDRSCDCPNEKAVYTVTEGPRDPVALAPKWIHEQRETVDWVIVGGESGPKARAMHPDWVRSLRDQCQTAGTKFFFKQWGEYLPWSQFNGAAIEDDPEQTRFSTFEWDGERWDHIDRPMWCDSADGNIDDTQCVGRVGKKAAGRLLDGVEYSGMPEIAR